MQHKAASLAIAVVALLAVRGKPSCDAERSYECYHPSTPPRMDGDVRNDAAWRNIPSITGFSVLGGDYTEAKQTTVQVCWDDRYIYVAYFCEEPDAKELKPLAGDGDGTWLEDSVEIFLRPMEKGEVFQFCVTAGAAKGSGAGSPDTSKCLAAAKIGDDFYSLEIRIPFQILGTVTPKPGERWTGNFCRNVSTFTSGGDKFTCWAPLQNRFLEPEHFATIRFIDKALTKGEQLEPTQRLNKQYTEQLRGKLRAAAEKAGEYEEALREAAGNERFSAEARQLLNQWRNIEQANREANTASVSVMRRALRDINRLVKASHQLKYRYLIAKLIGVE